MASLMRSAASLLRRPAVSSAQWVLRRRSSYYKPREQSLYADAVEKLSTRDVTLFRYENPGFITRRNLVAVLFVPIFGQMAHLAFTLKSRLDPYREQAEDAAGAAGRAWVQDNVFRASRGVGIAFFLAGVSLCAYWVLRNLHTVRQLVLRRGGKHLTIVSYGFTGGMSRVSTVPVVHCSVGRHTFREETRFFLKVHDHYMSYQLNVKDGVFTNRPLFDRVVKGTRQF